MNTVFDSVSPHFSGLEEGYFNSAFKPSSDAVALQMGDLFLQNRFFDKTTLSHKQLSTWLGQYAMYSVPNTSYRFWADIDAYNDDLPWKLAVWRLMHVLPLGHAFSNNAFKVNDLLSWNPLQKPAERGMTVKGSNRPLYANSISQGLFHKLFPEYFEQPSAMFLSALLDVFAPSPNRDNPFYIAIRDSIRTTLIRSPYPVPYFWHNFILQFIAKSERDIANYEKSTESVLDTHEFNIEPYEDDLHAPSSQISEAGDDTATVASTPTTPIVSSETEVTPTPLTAKSLLIDLIAKTEFTNFKSPDISHITLLLTEIGSLVSQQIETGAFPVNAPSAFAHKVDDRFFIVYPSGLERMQTLLGDTITAETLDNYFKGLALIVERDAYLTTPSGGVIDIKLVELHHQFVPAFFPDFSTLANNNKISIKETASV